MNPLFGKKCPNCGNDNQRDAVFCQSCGEPFANRGRVVCSVCGTDNRQGATYCKECGAELAAHELVETRNNRWSREEGDFAVKLEVDDLPGLFSKKLEVVTGTQALVYTSGVPQEILPPGIYTLDSVGLSISNWLKGVPKIATVLLVDTMPSEMTVTIEKRFTSDPLPISLSMKLVVEVRDAAKFVLAALHNRERFAMEDLRQYVQPEIADITDAYLRARTLEQLVQNPRTRDELELAIEEALRSSFDRYGLKLVSMRTLTFDLQAYDKVKGITGQYSLLVAEGEAEVAGKQRILDLRKKIDIQTLSEETAKVENEERKVELYQRMRASALTDKMNEVRSEAEFAKFMDEMDRTKLLSEKERQDLLRGWKEEAEDHDRARSFLLAKSEVEEKYLLKAIEIKSTGELNLQEQDYQLELERKRAAMTLQIEREKWQAALEQDQADAELGISLLKKLKMAKLEVEEQALKLRLDEARANVDIEIEKLEAEHKREMERLDKLGTLGSEALIAASPVEQGKILQDLKKAEIFKSMSEEQILALAAEKSPELGRVFEEKFRAIAEGKAKDNEKELYERLFRENQESQRLMVEAQKDAMDRLQHMSEHDVDAIKDISKAYAQGGGTPVVIAGAGGSRVIRASGESGLEEESKICPKCGRRVDASSRFCPYCSNAFADLN